MSKGEGSRGGHVIGHTKSGTPIYGSAADHAAKVDAGKRHGAQPIERLPDDQDRFAGKKWKRREVVDVEPEEDPSGRGYGQQKPEKDWSGRTYDREPLSDEEYAAHLAKWKKK